MAVHLKPWAACLGICMHGPGLPPWVLRRRKLMARGSVVWRSCPRAPALTPPHPTVPPHPLPPLPPPTTRLIAGAALQHRGPHLRRRAAAPSPRRRLVACSAAPGRRQRLASRGAQAATRTAPLCVLASPCVTPRHDGAQTATHPPHTLGWLGSGGCSARPRPGSQQQHPGAQPLRAPQQQQQQLPSSPPQQQQRQRAPWCRRLAGQRRRGKLRRDRQQKAGGRRGRRRAWATVRAGRGAAGLQRRRRRRAQCGRPPAARS